MELTLSQQRRRTAVSTLGDPKILGPAVLGAFRKLDPRLMIRNPVMFTVEVVASLTTVLFIRDLVTGAGGLGFSFQINLWLWFTVLFANFAEAVAEGRGKAQAATLRKAKTDTVAKRLANISDVTNGKYVYDLGTPSSPSYTNFTVRDSSANPGRVISRWQALFTVKYSF